MPSKFGQYDGAIFGTILGFVIAIPSFGEWIFDFLESVIPTTWDWFGTSTITILIVATFALAGFIFDKSR